MQLGDITNHNTEPEWKNAVAALSKLDGVVPTFLTLGNHDYSDKGACKDRTTLFNKYFDIAKARKTPNFGGVYDKEPAQLENAYYTFEAGGQKFLVLCLEFGPRADVIRWANAVLAKHPEHATILNTHAYMYYDETRYDWAKYATKQTWNPHAYAVAKATNDDVTDGEELWQKLVRNNPQVFLTLNGHVLNDGLGRLSSDNARGKPVHQLLVNFQMKPKGGDVGCGCWSSRQAVKRSASWTTRRPASSKITARKTNLNSLGLNHDVRNQSSARVPNRR